MLLPSAESIGVQNHEREPNGIALDSVSPENALERDNHDLHVQERKMSSDGPRVAVGRTETVIAKKEAALRRP